jgi:hypothetical protein
MDNYTHKKRASKQWIHEKIEKKKWTSKSQTLPDIKVLSWTGQIFNKSWLLYWVSSIQLKQPESNPISRIEGS